MSVPIAALAVQFSDPLAVQFSDPVLRCHLVLLGWRCHSGKILRASPRTILDLAVPIDCAIMLTMMKLSVLVLLLSASAAAKGTKGGK